MKSLEDIPVDYRDTFNRHLKIFEFLGLYIFRSPNASFLSKYYRIILLNCMFLPFIWFQVLFIAMSNHNGTDFLEVASAVPVAVSLIQDLIKMTVILLKADEIRQVILEIADLWPKREDLSDEKTQIVDTWLKRLRIFDDSYSTVTIVACAMFQATPLMIIIYNYFTGSNTSYPLPFLLYHPKEINSTAQYVATYIYEVLSFSFLHIGIFLPTDFLLVALTSDISILLLLLQNDIEQVKMPMEPIDRGYFEPKNYKEIKNIVKTHQKLLRLADKVNRIFGPVVFILVSFSSLIICFFGFLTVVVSGMKILKNFVPVVVIVFTVFNLSWPGQFLYDASSGVADAAYRSLWYESDLKFRKFIFIIIARSQHPCRLSAMGFSDMTLTAFSKVLSTAWSYLSLLRQVYQNIKSE